MGKFGDTVDAEDIDRFAAQSGDWWDPRGGFRPLHQINPARIDFIRRRLLAHFCRDARSLRPFDNLSLADIGCGGGLVAEPMTRLGFSASRNSGMASSATNARHGGQHLSSETLVEPCNEGNQAECKELLVCRPGELH